MDTDAAPRVLVIGLDPYRVPGPWDPEPAAQAIEEGLNKFAEHGVGAETCLFGLDGSDDVEAVVGKALRAHRWECVTVGGGLRHSDDQVAPRASDQPDSAPRTRCGHRLQQQPSHHLRGRRPLDRVTATNHADRSHATS
ncbi:hypothetical protein [Phaeacidiphilus oryzae]|uniref:hypothetical protein n=1 Tax=Phaeacidiphilus oryzae TaxID=348818 RepID=UPI00190F1187|nr:hypothetical protein [Phaeacidiphilus oryzae]